MGSHPLLCSASVVKAFPSERADKSFIKPVLPWGRRRSIANTDRSKSSDEDLAIGPVPVTDQIARSLFPATCFGELICDPFCSRMRCNEGPFPTSTVPMGADSDPTVVVDAWGNVRGVEALRVVDTSILPDIPSAATDAT